MCLIFMVINEVGRALSSRELKKVVSEGIAGAMIVAPRVIERKKCLAYRVEQLVIIHAH